MAWKTGEVVLSKKTLGYYEKGRYVKTPKMSRFVVVLSAGYVCYTVSEETFRERLPQILACKRLTRKKIWGIFTDCIYSQICTDFVSERVFVEGLKGLI